MSTPVNTFRKLPIGIQSFEFLRSEGYLYVDKTALIYRLVTKGKLYFLSRPRRFGKSLLLSTLEAYFKGKKELFEGLAIEQLEQNWFEYPVLHLDLNAEKYDSRERLEKMLELQLESWETTYGVDKGTMTYSGRFSTIIQRAYEQTGHRVVVLVDEYDKPMLQTFDNPDLQEDFRKTLTAFYTVLKSADPYLQFVFITGVTKFAQMGIFSTLNQLNDISFDLEYNTLCGMTRTEIEATFIPELQALTEQTETTYEQAVEQLARQYDGYRFTPEKGFTPMYNPFSVLSALAKSRFGDYWFASGTPTFLVEMLKRTDLDLRELDGIEVSSASLKESGIEINNPIPIMYQSGYLTIKTYYEHTDTYALSFPNEEVRYSFLHYAVPLYTPLSYLKIYPYIVRSVRELRSGDIEAFLNRLTCFFADFPYELNVKTERHYQVVFYLVFKLMGQFTQAEVRTAKGRADAVVKTADYIYVFEFKLHGTAEEALKQIDDKGYLLTIDGRQLVKVGVAFDAEKRNLGKWLIG
ncbi:ATP-binding protein [Bacteroides faecium]|uniref:ATP-binding protein n=1 Tax=Bacteroides faecium TaxID=2715212 RepID=A0A6H0KSU4_9BACE|nr:ATP-binding protein [Bacteroides faecium]QIU96480.1 ATP-binding protein [Bacteroides faecium]